MKKVIYLFGLFLAISFIACSEDEEQPISPDSIPMAVYINVVDNEGRNLLDSDIEGNIRGNEIKVFMNEKTYYVQDLEKNPQEKGLYIIDNLLYCRMFFNDPDLKQELQIDWGNGHKDIIELKMESSWTYYLNGKKAKGKYADWIEIVI